MKVLIAFLPLIFVLVSCGQPAAPEPDRVADEEAIHALIAGLTEAWTAGDGDAWAAHFAIDAEFTVWFGLRLSGRERIAWGHNIIFDDFYANTTFEMEAQKIFFPERDIAIALIAARVLREGQERPQDPDAVPLAVLRRTESAWEIVAFQNTPYAVDELRANGDLARFKAWARQMQDLDAND